MITLRTEYLKTVLEDWLASYHSAEAGQEVTWAAMVRSSQDVCNHVSSNMRRIMLRTCWCGCRLLPSRSMTW